MAHLLHSRFLPHALALAALQATCAAQAAEQVTITGKLDAPPASVAGFGDTPLAKSPFQALSIGSSALADQGAAALSSLTKLDASIADAYNAPGYWSALTVRGFVLDNRHNYQRDGLPINAETAIALENKERIEVLKGTSGAQAGISSPGGLANLVVKRPRGVDQSSILVGWSERGNVKAAVDIERRLGEGDAIGVRLNAAVETLDPVIHDLQGHRHLLALAGSLRPSADRRFDAEIELSHDSQPSMPGFSLLGTRVPSASEIDPRTNLNNQAWTLPVVFDGTTASLRWTENLGADWQLVAQAMSQQLRTDDRIAFPFGCTAEGNFDRYCSDGSFDLYDYRSEGERRDTLAGAITLSGQARLGGMAHQLSAGLSWTDFRMGSNTQIFNLAGVGQIDGSVQVDPNTEFSYPTAARHERSTELHLRDRVDLTTDTRLWLGLRHTRLDRSSDGVPAYKQSFTTPWVALSQQLSDSTLVYGSWGQGIETEVAPNLLMYSNANQPLPALKSEQVELGLKFNQADWNVGLTLFDIRRPASEDIGVCDGTDGSCTRRIDGNARHRGIEANAEARWSDVTLQASAQWLRARREGATEAAKNGTTPANVAERSARVLATWQVPSLTGLGLQASMSHEGPRYVLPDDSARIPGWTTFGLASRYSTRAFGHEWLLRVGVDNLFDRRAWKESPYQFSHAYLYPLEPRTFRASLQATL